MKIAFRCLTRIESTAFPTREAAIELVHKLAFIAAHFVVRRAA
jgi:hypothetical protein